MWTFVVVGANKCSSLGLLLSAIGLVALSLLSFWRFDVIRYATASSLLGALVSLVGLFWKPRRQALLGLLLGGVVSLYLPMGNTFITSSSRWLMTLTAMRPFLGLPRRDLFQFLTGFDVVAQFEPALGSQQVMAVGRNH